MVQNLTVIIIEKTGTIKTTTIKEFKEEDLFKKCGFKKNTDFIHQTDWSIKLDGKKYKVGLFAKKDGKANNENKYDFPPPVDNDLYFGSCALVCKVCVKESEYEYTSFTVELWEKMYEKLFGGFENLALTSLEDENEEDELANIPAEKKTKQGYLKDGFVIDSEEDDLTGTSNSSEDEDEEEEEVSQLEIEDIGSELSSEEYDYSDTETETETESSTSTESNSTETSSESDNEKEKENEKEKTKEKK